MNLDRHRLVLRVGFGATDAQQVGRPDWLTDNHPALIGTYARVGENEGAWLGAMKTTAGPLLVHSSGLVRLDEVTGIDNQPVSDETRRLVIDHSGGDPLLFEYPRRAYGWDWYCAEEADVDFFLDLAKCWSTPRFRAFYTEPSRPWSLVYQDLFDRETPNLVDREGPDLRQGLGALWARHLGEGLSERGGRGLAQFWLRIDGSEAVQLGDDGAEPSTWSKLKGWDDGSDDLTGVIGLCHADILASGLDDPVGRIVTEASQAPTREAFLRRLG